MAKVCIAVLIPLVLASLAQGHICPEGVCDVQADQTISLLQHDIVAEHGARVRAQLTPKDSGGEGQTNAIMQVGTDSKDSGGEGETKAMMHVGTDSKDSGGEGETNAIMQVGTDSKDSGGEGETKAMMQDSGGEGETNAIMQVGTDSKAETDQTTKQEPGCSSDASWGKYNKADGMWWAGSGFFKGHDSGNDRHYRTNWNTPEKCRAVCDRTPKCACFVHNPVGACYMYDSSCLTNTKIANPRVNAYTKCCKTNCGGGKAVTPYKVSGYGSKDCPSGSQPITDLGTCQAAQRALGKRWAGTHSWSNIQSGCFSHANNHVWYNKHPNGRPHSAFSRVCKASASNGGSYVKLGNGRCNHAKGYPSHYGFGVGVQKCRGLCDAHSWCIGYDTRNNHMCALYPKKGAPQSPAAAGLRADPGKKWGGLYHDQGFGELVKVAPPLTGECFKKTGASQGGAYTCTEKANFITGIRYSQRSLTDGCRGRVCNANPIYGSPNSIGRAVGWCKAHCGKQAGCTGFFFQRHGNGHEICGFYNSNMHAAGARWSRHGHQAGSQVCEKRASSALLESQEQAHETVDTQDDGVFEQPLEDDMDMADDSSDENDMENADDSSHENDMDADDSLNEDPASFVQKLIDEDEEGEENEEDPASFVQKLIDEDEEAP